jgi:hypothetical protein
MNRHIAPVLLCTVLSVLISSLAAQYNPNYRLLERKQFLSGPGGPPIETNLYYYSGPTATYPDSIYNSVSYGSDIITEIDFNDQGLKQELRSYSELSPDWGSVYHIDYDAEGRPVLSYTGAFHSSFPNAVETRNHYSYSEGRLSEILGWEYNDPNDPVYDKWVFDYDTEGNPIEALHYMSTDSTNFSIIDLSSRKVWTYSEGRNGDAMALLDTWADNTYFDTVHPLIPSHQPDSETHQQYFHPDWLNSSRKVYSYDAQNKLTGLLTYSYINGNWVLGRSELFTYGADGNLLYHQGNNLGGTDEYIWQNMYPSDIETPDIIQPSLEISVYPHPFAEQTQIVFKSGLAGPARVMIFNLRGQHQLSWHALPGEHLVWDGKDEHGIDCPSGIYLIKVVQNGRSVSKRIIRNR